MARRSAKRRPADRWLDSYWNPFGNLVSRKGGRLGFQLPYSGLEHLEADHEVLQLLLVRTIYKVCPRLRDPELPHKVFPFPVPNGTPLLETLKDDSGWMITSC